MFNLLYLVVFDNIVSKYRDRKLNASVIAVGNDVYADQTARANAKSPFDGNVVCDFERMEYVFDYAFVKLGIDTNKLHHPILVTEPVCVPQYNRKYEGPMVNKTL
ncbi:hypothetical protein BC938DRAFT_478911 [Jimgerdemannia flammicorona]|uniref:Uncharacterized protein n=1 Tax=Jimgerdemannia flammicorona TaxID=994334 RepID=A0A433QM36_9FUNG|nr:hypothetical protein BC938DRAFT_478911 [Jimgerdemannia flammicorona]